MKSIFTLAFSFFSIYIFAQSIDSCALNVPKNRTICKGSSTILCNDKPLPNVDYTWSPATGVANVKNLNTSFSPTASSSYVLKVKATTCQKNYNVTLDVANLNIALSNLDTLNFCKSQPSTTVLAVSKLIGIGTIIWEKDGKPLDSLKNFGTLKVTPTVNTKYIAYFKNDECTVKDSVQFRIFDDVKDLKIQNLPTDICIGQSVKINVSPYDPNNNYQWTLTPNVIFSQKNDTITFTPTSSTTIKIVAKNPACQSETTTNLVVKNNQVVTINASKSNICSGDTLTIYSNLKPTKKLLWSATSFVCLDSLCTKIRVSPTKNTTYTVEENTDDNCKAKGSISITVNPSPTIQYPAKTIFCAGETVGEITLNAAPDASVQYTWQSIDDPKFITSNEPAPKASPLKNAKYGVIMEKNGCKATDTVTIKIIEGSIKIMGEQQVCQGEPSKLTFSTSFPANVINSFQWISGGKVVENNVKPEKNINVYFLEIKYTINETQCFYRDSVVIFAKPLPQGEILINGDNLNPMEVFEGSIVDVSFKSSNNLNVTSYEWTKNNFNLDAQKNKISFKSDNLTEKTFFTLKAKGENGCSNLVKSSEIILKQPELPIFPLVILPNDANADDAVFKKLPSKGDSDKVLLLEKMTIYNRWGNLVYEGDANTPAWNGQQNKTDVLDDVYFYKAVFKNIFTQKRVMKTGEVVLMR